MVCLVFLASGCSSVKKWTGMTTPDEEEVAREAKEAAAPELVGETVVIDGKTYVRSRNPYYLTYPAEPEYVYAEKGKEFVGIGETLSRMRSKITGKDTKATTGVPPEQVQEMVRQEVERIMREQGRGGELFPVQGEIPQPVQRPGRGGSPGVKRDSQRDMTASTSPWPITCGRTCSGKETSSSFPKPPQKRPSQNSWAAS